MSDQLTVQLQKMEKQYEDLKQYLESDGKVTSDERKTLDDAQTKLKSLRKKVEGRNGQTGSNGSPLPAVQLAPGDYLTEKAWKTELQRHAGKLKDNGLQRALAAYEKLKEERFDDRLKALQLVFKLALDLSSKGANGIQAAQEFLSKVAEISVKKQEIVQKRKDEANKAPVDPTQRSLAALDIITAANLVSVNAEANVSTFGQEISDACAEFESYAKDQLSDLEDEMTPQELLGSLVGAVMPTLTEKLVQNVTHELGKKLVKQIAETIGDKLTNAVKSAGKESSKKDLEKAVGTMVRAARDSRSAVLQVVTKTVIPTCDAVVQSVNAGKTLSPQLTAFIEPFVRVEKSALDAKLEAWFGVPPPKKSKATQLQIYQDLVRAFEEKVIIAKTPSGEKMEWNVKGVPANRIRRAAEMKAERAARERARTMAQNEAKGR